MNLLENQRAAEAIDGVYLDLESMLMRNIVRHLKAYEQPIDSDKWLLQKLAEIGRLNAENIKLIASMSGMSQTATERMLNEAALDAIKNVDPGIKALAKQGLAGKPVAANKSKNVQQVLKGTYSQAKDTLNLCNTNMLYKAREAYKRLVGDVATESKKLLAKHAVESLTGVESRQQAMIKCIREFNERGIPAFVDKRGREWTPEAYVNMAMRNTAKSVADEVQDARCKDSGIDFIAIDAHSGARPKCAKDQGKIFSLSNKSGEIEDGRGRKIKFYAWSSSSYGDPDGLLGINCGHHKRPFVPGVNIHRYFPTEDLDANNALYRETQVQRALERDVRKQKRLCMMYDELDDKEAFEDAAIKLKSKEAALKNHVNKNNQLHRRKDREQVVGFDKTVSAKAISRNATARKREYEEFVGKVGSGNAPSFAKYSTVGYNKSEEFKQLKALGKYRESVPEATLANYQLNQILKDKKLIKGKVTATNPVNAFILEDLSSKDPTHVMKRMLERNITDDQVRGFINNAVLCEIQHGGLRRVYYSKDGVAVVTKTTDYGVDWIVKTTWSNLDFTENTDKLIEEVMKYVQSR